MSAARIVRVTAQRANHQLRVSSSSSRSWQATQYATSRQLDRQYPLARAFSVSRTLAADTNDPHHEESFEEFTARYEQEFEGVEDSFELQRNLNNCFAYDLVPSTSVITAALRAARRVNDFPTAVRIFEGIKAKVENQGQYDQYLKELEPIREELGISLKESMYPNSK